MSHTFSVHNSNPKFSAKMELAAKLLNIKGHYVYASKAIDGEKVRERRGEREVREREREEMGRTRV